MEEKIDEILLSNFKEGDWQTARKQLLDLFGLVIQLPTDEEISQADIALFDEYVEKEYAYIGGLFSKGAKWMRDKIYKGN